MDAFPFIKGQEYIKGSSFTRQGKVIRRIKSFAMRRRDVLHYIALRRCSSEDWTKHKNMLIVTDFMFRLKKYVPKLDKLELLFRCYFIFLVQYTTPVD